MKLSEVKGERAIEVIADIIQPITNIAVDQQNLKLFRMERHDGESEREAAIRDLTGKIPALLRTHKADVLAILCAVNGTDPKDLSIVDIIKGAVDLVNDKDFMSLFLSAAQLGDLTPPTQSSEIQTPLEPES